MGFRFGTEEVITPPMKMGLTGYFNTRIWSGVLDHHGETESGNWGEESWRRFREYTA